MSEFNPKSAPIKFRKVEAGHYVSEDGRYDLKKTTHTGPMWGGSPIRWWLNDVSDADHPKLIRGHAREGYFIAMEDAIQHINMRVPVGFRRVAEMFLEWARQNARQAELDAVHQREIERVTRLLDRWVLINGPDCMHAPEGREALAIFLTNGGS